MPNLIPWLRQTWSVSVGCFAAPAIRRHNPTPRIIHPIRRDPTAAQPDSVSSNLLALTTTTMTPLFIHYLVAYHVNCVPRLATSLSRCPTRLSFDHCDEADRLPRSSPQYLSQSRRPRRSRSSHVASQLRDIPARSESEPFATTVFERPLSAQSSQSVRHTASSAAGPAPPPLLHQTYHR